MSDWREKLDAFLKFNEREVLENAGKMSMDIAKELAVKEYEKFHKHRLVKDSDSEAQIDDEFEQKVKQIEKGEK